MRELQHWQSHTHAFFFFSQAQGPQDEAAAWGDEVGEHGIIRMQVEPHTVPREEAKSEAWPSPPLLLRIPARMRVTTARGLTDAVLRAKGRPTTPACAHLPGRALPFPPLPTSAGVLACAPHCHPRARPILEP